ncbi:UNVERIFIED_CONTAM: hypothetical protein H355_012385 [Colinus virginianus]|nr:hypothetical protein H355_012385 [Colinus virginianus]
MMIDLGTGNNNKINWALNNKHELIDIIECIYRGARKGKLPCLRDSTYVDADLRSNSPPPPQGLLVTANGLLLRLYRYRRQSEDSFFSPIHICPCRQNLEALPDSATVAVASTRMSGFV